MKQNTQRLAYLGLCTSVAMILAYAETLLPPLFAAVPGIKLGLPNIAIIFILYQFGMSEAIAVSIVRVFAVSLLFGNPVTLAYSAAGAILSLVVMALLKKTDWLSTVGVSVAGGVLHNIGQILVAMLLLGTAELGYYLIVLTLTGIISGIFVGFCAAFAIKRINVKKISKNS